MKIPIEFSLPHFSISHFQLPSHPKNSSHVGWQLARSSHKRFICNMVGNILTTVTAKANRTKEQKQRAKKHNIAWAIKNTRVKRAKWNKKALLPRPLPLPLLEPQPCHCQLWHPLVVIVVCNFCLLPLAFTVILTTSNVCVCGVHMKKVLPAFGRARN